MKSLVSKIPEFVVMEYFSCTDGKTYPFFILRDMITKSFIPSKFLNIFFWIFTYSGNAMTLGTN